VALHPAEPIGPYAFEVHHRIRRDERTDYPRTARSLEACADVVSIQFDEAAWGGDDGDAVLDFVRALSLPAAVTLHTLHPDPTPRQREILLELVGSVQATVVMSRSAAALLAGGYGIDPKFVETIPYGVPDLPLVDAGSIKPSVGLGGRDVILSFGLLHPGKGHELMLDALPAIVAAHPNVCYVIAGATHPDVVRRDAQTYRSSLASRVAELGLDDHVRFVGEFLGRVELTRLLESADVFVTPSPDPGRTLSGPLTYAMGAGRAIVSTPYPYAAELLAGGRGSVVAAATPKALAAAIIGLLNDPALRASMGMRAHDESRRMTWTRVGAEYAALFARLAMELPNHRPSASIAVAAR
jgi:glycosyltransferase involved in cell wall biosynthesis